MRGTSSTTTTAAAAAKTTATNNTNEQHERTTRTTTATTFVVVVVVVMTPTNERAFGSTTVGAVVRRGISGQDRGSAAGMCASASCLGAHAHIPALIRSSLNAHFLSTPPMPNQPPRFAGHAPGPSKSIQRCARWGFERTRLHAH